MSGLLAYGFLKKAVIPQPVSQQQSDKRYGPAVTPNDGTNDPSNPININNMPTYDTSPPPNFMDGPQEGIQQNMPWYRNAPGNGQSLKIDAPPPNYNKANDYLFGAPAEASRGFGGGNQNIHFNPLSGRYEAFSSSGLFRADTASMNALSGISEKPHIEYDEATGKYFRPAPGNDNSPSFMALKPNPTGANTPEVKAINPSYVRARQDWQQRNNPNSVLGQEKNNLQAWLLDNKSKGHTFANWKNTPAMNTLQNQGAPGTGLPRGQTAPTPAQYFKKNAPTNVRDQATV